MAVCQKTKPAEGRKRPMNPLINQTRSIRSLIEVILMFALMAVLLPVNNSLYTLAGLIPIAYYFLEGWLRKRSLKGPDALFADVKRSWYWILLVAIGMQTLDAFVFHQFVPEMAEHLRARTPLLEEGFDRLQRGVAGAAQLVPEAVCGDTADVGDIRPGACLPGFRPDRGAGFGIRVPGQPGVRHHLPSDQECVGVVGGPLHGQCPGLLLYRELAMTGGMERMNPTMASVEEKMGVVRKAG